MAAEEEALKAALAADLQWKQDVLDVLLRICGYEEARTQAAHATLAALAEINAKLAVEQEGEGGSVEVVSIAQLLEDIAADEDEGEA